MFSFAKLFHHLFVEGRDVVRFAAGDEAIVHHYFFVDPVRAGITKIGLDRRPRSDRSPTHYTSIDQDPWCVTDCRNWFAGLEKMYA